MSAETFGLCVAIVLNTLGCVAVVLLLQLATRIDLLQRKVSMLTEALLSMTRALEFLSRDENWSKAREEVRDAD